MRCKDNIEITMKIPIAVDKPNVNGYIYKKEAIEKAIESGSDLPIVFSNSTDNDDKVFVIGHTNKVEFLDKEKSFLICGEIYHGGTCESVINSKLTKNGLEITDMTLLSLGVCYED